MSCVRRRLLTFLRLWTFRSSGKSRSVEVCAIKVPPAWHKPARLEAHFSPSRNYTPRSPPDPPDVLAQPEMEKRRCPLVSIPPFGRGFSRHGVFRSDGGSAAQERVLTPPFIVSMSPPGYSLAWLRPRSARFRFTRQDHCSSATTCRFSTSGGPVVS